MNNKISILAAAALMLPSVAGAGLINDYLLGIGVSAPLANDAPAAWVPGAGFTGSFSVDDSVAVNGFVDPGYGGQPYDLEALYLQRSGADYLITGISGAPQVGAPGTPPPLGVDSTWTDHGTQNWGRKYGLGDFFVGALTGTTFDPLFAIELDGFTYEIDVSGYTNGQTAAHAAGTVVNGMDVRHGLINWGGVSDPTQISNTSGVVQGAAAMSYEYLNANHTGFQARIDASLFDSLLGGTDNAAVHWGEACGNDYVLTAFTTTQVPVPAPVSLLAVGLLGMLGIRRRKVSN